MIIADLHLHSYNSRATSKDLNLENTEKWGRIKGVTLMGTGDFQHPEWLKELKSKLTEDGTGILKSKTGYPYMLTTEISLIYSQDGKGRRNHLIVWSPDFVTADKIQAYLLEHGRIDYDGRPIFKIPCNEFVKDLKSISDRIEIIPAHIWTPHFSVMGDYNQYKHIEECFKDQLHHIYALETGISSDPGMNWRLSQFDRFQMVSFSDAHSFWPWRLGRESTIFDCELTYDAIIHAVRTGEGLHGTIESEPHFGKYHFTGHRNCEVCVKTQDAISLYYKCPKCGKKMPKGVHDRIEELADRKEGYKKKDGKPFYLLIPLHELLSAYYGFGINTKKCWEMYDTLVDGTTENDVLLWMDKKELLKRAEKDFVDVILANRRGKIPVQPGYDGVYGVPLFKGEKVTTFKVGK